MESRHLLFLWSGPLREESTFGVTAPAVRGIPARQIYVPWWSHCDDNLPG